MASKKNIILGIGSATVLILCFQNCTPTIYSQVSGNFEKSSTDPGSNQPQGANDPQVPATDPQVPVGNPPSTDPQVPTGNPPVPPVNPPVPPVNPPVPPINPPVPAVDPRQTEPGEVKCESSLIQAAIAYDSLPVTQAAPVSFAGGTPTNINAEYISFIGSIIVPNLNITSRQIDEISGITVDGRLNVNAQKIGLIGGIIGGKIHLVARSIQDPSSVIGDLCMAANKIPNISGVSGSMTIFGRSLNGVKATIGRIGGVIGYLSMYDIDVTSVESIASDVKLENVHLKTLNGGSGDVILVNSQIDQLGSFIGTVHLRGNSKIGSILTPTTVTVIQE